jgi:hypothetical protein
MRISSGVSGDRQVAKCPDSAGALLVDERALSGGVRDSLLSALTALLDEGGAV